MAHDDTHPEIRAWARVRLEEGSSAGEVWDVSSEVPGLRLDVGSGPSSMWQVDFPGVAPRHLTFFWDGELLWLADLFGAGNATVNGMPLGDWVPLTGTARIDFGTATLMVEASASEVVEDLPAEGLSELEASPTLLAGRAHYTGPHDRSARILHGEAPPPLLSSSTRMLTTGHALDPEDYPTRFHRLPPSRPERPDPPTWPAEPSHPFGPPGEFPGVVSRPVAAEPPPDLDDDDDDERPLDPLATRLVGTADPRVQDRAPRAKAGLGARRVRTDPAVVPHAGVDAFPDAVMDRPDPAPEPVPEPERNPEPAELTSREEPKFAAPPPALASPRTLADRVRALMKKVPARTWLLAVFTAAVAIVGGAMTLVDTKQGGSAPPPSLPDKAASEVAPSPPEAPSGPPRSLLPKFPPPEPVAENDGEADEATSARRGGRPGRRSRGDTETTAEQEAADLLLSGRYAEALKRYEALAEEHEERAVFAAIARMLRKRLRAQCKGGIDSEGNPCHVD